MDNSEANKKIDEYFYKKDSSKKVHWFINDDLINEDSEIELKSCYLNEPKGVTFTHKIGGVVMPKGENVLSNKHQTYLQMNLPNIENLREERKQIKAQFKKQVNAGLFILGVFSGWISLVIAYLILN